MAAFNKFNQFVEDLGLGVHNLSTGALRVYLSNAVPSVSLDLVKTDLAEIAAGNGYVAQGELVGGSWTETAGTGTKTGVDIVWTATGAIGPFQYAVLFNDTPTAPVDPVIGWWDYGTPISLAIGETFTVDFGASVFTIA